MKKLSKIAQTSLETVMDYEIHHVNWLSGEDVGKNAVDWHRDSYPFTCVLFLKGASEGGELELQAMDGSTILIPTPAAVGINHSPYYFFD